MTKISEEAMNLRSIPKSNSIRSSRIPLPLPAPATRYFFNVFNSKQFFYFLFTFSLLILPCTPISIPNVMPRLSRSLSFPLHMPRQQVFFIPKEHQNIEIYTKRHLLYFQFARKSKHIRGRWLKNCLSFEDSFFPAAFALEVRQRFLVFRLPAFEAC